MCHTRSMLTFIYTSFLCLWALARCVKGKLLESNDETFIIEQQKVVFLQEAVIFYVVRILEHMRTALTNWK